MRGQVGLRIKRKEENYLTILCCSLILCLQSPQLSHSLLILLLISHRYLQSSSHFTLIYLKERIANIILELIVLAVQFELHIFTPGRCPVFITAACISAANKSLLLVKCLGQGFVNTMGRKTNYFPPHRSSSLAVPSYSMTTSEALNISKLKAASVTYNIFKRQLWC